MLVGRQTELAAIDQAVQRARDGISGALAVCGEPGIGKTSLLDYAATCAGDFTVLRVLGVESEAELPYAALHQLVHPLLDRLAALSPHQAQALESAFGIAPSKPAERFAIGVAVMTLLADACEERPLLCLLDDAQWFDRESLAVVGFAARRLQREGIVVLLAIRDDGGGPVVPGVQEMRLSRLHAADARLLLAEQLGTERSRAVSPQVIERSDGNPLALLVLATRAPGPDPLQTGQAASYVERAYLEQIEALPDTSRTALLVAAADAVADAVTVDAAAQALGAGLAALEPAERAELVRIDGVQVAFRHPLVRSAAYAAATFNARQEAHRALADVLSAEEDADRRAWHLAAASVGFDDTVADELERTAERARGRGGYAAAALALERAAERTADAAIRRRRTVDAAEMACSAGEFDHAIGLLDEVRELNEPHLTQRAASIRGTVALVRGDATRALELHLTVAQTAASRSPAAALGAARLALEAAMLGGRFERASEIRDAVAACPPAPGKLDEAARCFVEGLTALLLGEPARAAPSLARTVELGAASTDVRDLSAAAAAASYLGRPEEADALFSQAVMRTRAASAAGMLALMLQYHAIVELWIGRLGDAEADLLESLGLARETEQIGVEAVLLALLAAVAALRGEEERCRELAAGSLAIAQPRGLELAVSATGYALGLLELGLGSPAAAFDHLDRVANRRMSHPIYRLMSVPDLVEAAARSGRPDAARAALDEFDAWARASGSPWTLSLAARARAITRPDEDAAPLFEQALAIHDSVRSPWLRARTELLYGEHLRRRAQRAEARAHLRSARDTFESLGAAPWTRRAVGELRATGETTQKRGETSASRELTPQELQVARLVATGATNRDVASQLFLSPKTVEYHLAKVFRKLEIASRTELVRLGERGPLGTTTRELPVSS